MLQEGFIAKVMVEIIGLQDLQLLVSAMAPEQPPNKLRAADERCIHVSMNLRSCSVDLNELQKRGTIWNKRVYQKMHEHIVCHVSMPL